MAEVIAELDYRVEDNSRAYFVNAVGESDVAGKWEVWLEFVPLDDAMPLVTQTETQQATRADAVRWANALTQTYVQGAFVRALRLADAPATRTAVTPLRSSDYDRVATTIDPFAVFALGQDALQLQLRSFTRAELLTIIDAHELNPAQLSLAWLSDSQLVTFIVTAIEAQILQGRGSGGSSGL